MLGFFLLTLTDTRVASGNEDDLVGEVAALQDVEGGRVPVVALWFHDNVFDRKRLPGVEIRAPLVDVAK